MPATPKDHLEYTVKEWESAYFNQILEKLTDIEVVYDIGANAGGFTVVLKKMFPHAEFHCFEPLPRNFEQLICVTGVHCHNVGVYYGKKEAKLQWRGENIGAIFIEDVDAGEPRVDTGEVTKLVELEELNIPKPTLVKLDVEGAEENILAHSTILKTTPWIILEWHPDHVDVFDFLKKHLPNHKIQVNLENKQLLLQYENNSGNTTL